MGRHARKGRWHVIIRAGALALVAAGGIAYSTVSSSQPVISNVSVSHAPLERSQISHSSPVVATPAPVPTVTVTSGQTLWEIASQYCHNGADWRVLYNANRSVIGANSSYLAPGLRLTLSC